MNKVNLFMLIPEQNPKFHWIFSIDNLIEEIEISNYIKKLSSFKNTIAQENYDGYYDQHLLVALSNQIKLLEDSYPQPTLRNLRSIFKDFFNWREDEVQESNTMYQIFNHTIEDHTFCEIAQRKQKDKEQIFALVNHKAITIQNQIVIKVDHFEHSFQILEGETELANWFSENRIPKRNFQSIPKHKILEPKQLNGKLISPLYGTSKNAQEILKTAIGIHLKELFGYDETNNMVIVFKHENETPQNQYHGYHVALDSDEIPKEIKIKLSI